MGDGNPGLGTELASWAYIRALHLWANCKFPNRYRRIYGNSVGLYTVQSTQPMDMHRRESSLQAISYGGRADGLLIVMRTNRRLVEVG